MPLYNLAFVLFQLIAPYLSLQESKILPGAYDIDAYLPSLLGKQVGICSNQTGRVDGIHLIDTLISLNVNVTKVFSPEHGFLGTQSAGEKVEYDSISQQYQLISLYGKNRKPTKEDLEGVEIMVFDIQDVGVRFYTYLSTLTYLMEACSENNIPLILLDRPNPNGSYVDGPVMDMAYKSFLGLHPIPIVHGLTPGEFAMMVNGEGWLENQGRCTLDVIKIGNWHHNKPYALPIKPSPNLPDDISIAWYPSLCLFEQTICSVGRGTDKAFQHIGHPEYPDQSYSFVPLSRPGAANPIFENKTCYGKDYGNQKKYAFTLAPLIEFYQLMDREDFFKPYFHRLAGNKNLQKKIEDGWTEEAIRDSWKTELAEYKAIRSKYLLYD